MEPSCRRSSKSCNAPRIHGQTSAHRPVGVEGKPTDAGRCDQLQGRSRRHVSGAASHLAVRYRTTVRPIPAAWSIRSRRRALSEGSRDCHNNLRCRGIFFRQSFQRPVKIGSVTDGTSHTFMIGENLPDYDNHSTAFYGNGDWCSCNIPLNNLLNVDPSTLNFQFWWDQQGFRSRHPGGADSAWWTVPCDSSQRM